MKDLFFCMMILQKGKNYEETFIFNKEKSKDKSIDNSKSIIQIKNTRLKDINRVIIGNRYKFASN